MSDRYLRRLARYFYAAGYDRDDMLQEARLAAWLAPSGLERLAARRRLIEIVRRSQRGGRPELCELVEHADVRTVEDKVLARDALRRIIHGAMLTPLEREAVGMRMRGEPYKGDKRIDNALHRARRKLAA